MLVSECVKNPKFKRKTSVNHATKNHICTTTVLCSLHHCHLTTCFKLVPVVRLQRKGKRNIFITMQYSLLHTAS